MNRNKILPVLLAAGSLCLTSMVSHAETLKVWIRASNDSKNIYKQLADEFEKKSGVHVEYFNTVTDFDQRLARAAAGNALPDVLFNDAIAIGQLVQLGIVEPIDPQKIQGGADLYDAAWKSASLPDGHYYGVPTSAHTYALFIRKDWREKLGLPQPKTWEDIRTLARAFTFNDPDGNGKADTYGFVLPAAVTRGYASSFISSYLWQAGGDFITPTTAGHFKGALDTPQAAQALGFIREMVCEKVVQPGAINATTADANPSFRSGQSGMYSSGPYHIPLFDKEPGKDRVEVVAPPAGPAGSTSMAEGTTAFLMKSSKNKADALKFIEFIISPEGQEIGMAQGSQNMPVVRLPVNKKVDIDSRFTDPRWKLFAEIYQKDGRYMPQIPNWIPVRNITAEGFNHILSDCKSDISGALKNVNNQVNDELNKQGVFAR